MSDLFYRTSAILSECRRFRYHLRREWDDTKACVVWIMLNPSTADAESDDATIRKSLGFSKEWDYGALEVVNLFAWRSVSPAALASADYPIGPDNDAHILRAATGRDCIAAWGACAVRGRVIQVLNLIRDRSLSLRCLGRNQDGSPKHPLYVSYKTTAQVFCHE